VQLFIDVKANLDKPLKKGITHSFTTVKSSHASVLQLLCDAKANLAFDTPDVGTSLSSCNE